MLEEIQLCSIGDKFLNLMFSRTEEPFSWIVSGCTLSSDGAKRETIMRLGLLVGSELSSDGANRETETLVGLLDGCMVEGGL